MFIPIPVLIVALVVGLLVFGLARSRGRRDPLEGMANGEPPRPLPTTPAEIEAEARTLIERGDTIGAIKLVREATGMSLKDSKEFIERL